ncbi:UNVERIFIED_CONTAM: hypothetical protein Slati_3138400 [Sesamum latifolium]|uniref:DUF4219 domain-containing protein n=1 Tax=Sesamum latifolium TaxID=2727402 RepID=A0AAW2UXY1_9LAMI
MSELFHSRESVKEKRDGLQHSVGIGPPVFTEGNYHIWAIKMEAYLRAQSLWDVVENDVDPPTLRANPTLAQIRKH